MTALRTNTPARLTFRRWRILPALSSLALRGAALCCALLLLFCPCPAQAQGASIPGFWDPKRRIEKPDLSQIRAIRFLTEDDYPPFHFIGPDGQLTGFEIDLARAICSQINVPCTVQARRWDTLQDTLARGQADAIIAALRVTPALRERFAFTASYIRTPARFLARQDAALSGVSVTDLKARRIAVAAGSAHEAYLRAYFPEARPLPVRDDRAALAAVTEAEADAAFIDGIGAAIWLNGEAGRACCRFIGGPFVDSAAFGEGAGIAVRRDNPRLTQALDWALARVAAEGTYAALYLKYFPVGFY